MDELDQLLSNENYQEIVKKLDKKSNLNHQEILYLGISYYKTGTFNKAEHCFEELSKSNPSNEVTTYLIISKIKSEKLFEALKLYESLCIQENKSIIKYIESKDYEMALNLTLFLKSIPLELPKKDGKSNDLKDLAKSYNYSSLSLALAEKIKNQL